jgi:hypothetical protein
MLRSENCWADVPLQSGGSVAAAADVDGDGAADLMVTSAGVDPEFQIWLSNTHGQFNRVADLGSDTLGITTDETVTFLGPPTLDWETGSDLFSHPLEAS